MIDKMVFACDILSAAVGLTSQRNGHSMSNFLLEWMQSWDFVSSAVLYEVYFIEADAENKEGIILRRFTDEITIERTRSYDQSLIACAQNKRQVAIELDNNVTQLVFPIKSTSGPLRLLSVENLNIEPQERLLCMHLTQLFNNQINVFDEKERDALTGLLNRQTFDNQLIKISSSQPKSENLAFLAVMDIDHFKKINDNYGHLYGDEVLLHFSQIMKRNFRYTDFLFRYGGEEFIVLLTDTTMEGAKTSLERFRMEVEDYNFSAAGQMTVSIGFVSITPEVLPTTQVDNADQALYNAKETGRNKLVYYNDICNSNEDNETDIEFF